MRRPAADVLAAVGAIVDPDKIESLDAITRVSPCPRCGGESFKFTAARLDWTTLWCPRCPERDLEAALQPHLPRRNGSAPKHGSAPAPHNPPRNRATVQPPEGAGLLDETVSFVRRYVVMSEAQTTAVALWVVHTHAIEAADVTPYLSITSAEKESGKTRLLEALEPIVARPWLTGRVTAAVLARKVDAERPTLLLDESDAAFGGEKEYAEALRGLLNTGYRYTGKASICVGQGASIGYKDFSTFGAKAIAGIGTLPDTVESRAIHVRLKRRAPSEHVERFRQRAVAAAAEPLHERVALWAELLIDDLAASRPALPDELGDRAQDSWEPLLAIADLAGGGWPARARGAALKLSEASEEAEDSRGVRLLRDVRGAFGGAHGISTVSLLGTLNLLDESPWGAWHESEGMRPRDLARLLKPYGVKPRPVRLAAGVAKGYLREQFEDAWGRYLPPPDKGLQGSQGLQRTPHAERDVTDVTDVTGPLGMGPTGIEGSSDAIAVEPAATPEQESDLERLRTKGFVAIDGEAAA